MIRANMIWIEGSWYVMEDYQRNNLPKYWHYDDASYFYAGRQFPKLFPTKGQPSDAYLTSVSAKENDV